MTTWRYDYNSPYQPGDVVYVLRRSNGDLKIGSTQSLKQRYPTLSKLGGYEQFEILATMPGYKAEERQLHERFAEYRLPVRSSLRKTDWFSPHPSIYSWVEKFMQPYRGNVDSRPVARRVKVLS